MRWIIAAAIALGFYKVAKTQIASRKYAGMVSSGWGGNLTGNLPGLSRPGGTVNQPPRRQRITTATAGYASPGAPVGAFIPWNAATQGFQTPSGAQGSGGG